MIPFFISLLIIVVSLIVSVLSGSPAVRCVMAILCMAGVWLMCLSWRRMYITMRRRNLARLARLEAENKQQSEVILSSNTERPSVSSTLPPMPADSSLKDRISALKAYFTPEITGNHNAEYRRLMADLEGAAELKHTLSAIGECSVQPLMEETKDIALPLDETAVNNIESQLLRLALATVDLSSGFRTNQTDSGSIASRLAAGQTTDDQAANMARKANDNVLETPRNIRVLRAVAARHPETPLYVNDYKL